MGRWAMAEESIPVLADRFKALSEPARLQLLRVLMHREHTVNELAERTGLAQANVSKHLQVLHGHGFVRRRKTGLFVRYALTDHQVARQVAALCTLLGRRDGDAPVPRPRGAISSRRVATRRASSGPAPFPPS